MGPVPASASPLGLPLPTQGGALGLDPVSAEAGTMQCSTTSEISPWVGALAPAKRGGKGTPMQREVEEEGGQTAMALQGSLVISELQYLQPALDQVRTVPSLVRCRAHPPCGVAGQGVSE